MITRSLMLTPLRPLRLIPGGDKITAEDARSVRTALPRNKLSFEQMLPAATKVIYISDLVNGDLQQPPQHG